MKDRTLATFYSKTGFKVKLDGKYLNNQYKYNVKTLTSGQNKDVKNKK
jgi:hypothetical protein